METVKIHFWKGTGVIGALIRFFSWGPVAHVAMEIDRTLYESIEGKGVISGPIITRRPPPTRTLVLECDSTQKQSMIDWWTHRIGWKYDWLSVFRFVYRRSETESTERRYFCSEAVMDAAAAAGIHLLERVDSSKVNPSMVYWSPILKKPDK